jgi:hypothetical protein
MKLPSLPSSLVRLYPRAWRARFEDEFTALLEQHSFHVRAAFDILIGAIDAHLYPQVHRENNDMQKSKPLAAIGFVLVLPACLVCLSGFVQFRAPEALIHPAVVLGGLAAALVLNILPVVRVTPLREDGCFEGAALTVRVQGRLLNVAVTALSLVLVTALGLYLFGENFQPR